MAASSTAVVEDHGDFITNRSWMIVFSVALLFGIVWVFIGESSLKILFTAAAFALFLRSAIRTEMSARAMPSSHH